MNDHASRDQQQMTSDEIQRHDDRLFAVQRVHMLRKVQTFFDSRQAYMTGEDRIRDAHLFFQSNGKGECAHLFDLSSWLPESVLWVPGIRDEFEERENELWTKEILSDAGSGQLVHISNAEVASWGEKSRLQSRRQEIMLKLHNSLQQWRGIDDGLQGSEESSASRNLPEDELPNHPALFEAPLSPQSPSSSISRSEFQCDQGECRDKPYITSDKGHYNRHIASKHQKGPVYVCPFPPNECRTRAKKRTLAGRGSFFDHRSDNFKRHIDKSHRSWGFANWSAKEQKTFMEACKYWRMDAGIQSL